MRNNTRTTLFSLALFLTATSLTVLSQTPAGFKNKNFLDSLNKDKSYIDLRRKIVAEFSNAPAGRWGEFVEGVDETIQTQSRIVAFTFDACGGRGGNGYDRELIDYLRMEKIPATLFISGKWIDAQFNEFINLSRDSLFEIENHGFNHIPCSTDGEKAYGIKGTSGIKEAFDEIEANARKIEAITTHRPRLYRSATAYINEECVKIAYNLGITTISFQILSGDAVPFTPASVIEADVLKKVKPGAIIIMHFNHPEWNTKEALQNIVPKLRQKGYSFVRLKDFKLISPQKNTR